MLIITPRTLISVRFVVHALASVDELQLAACDQRHHVGLHRVILLPPPAHEESHLNHHKGAVWVRQKLVHDAVVDVLDGTLSNVVAQSPLLLVEGLQPG